MNVKETRDNFKVNEAATVYGRVMLVRQLSKKLTFMTVQDREAKIQVAVLNKEIPQRWDIIKATGVMKPSDTGELTIWTEKAEVLAHCEKNPPDKVHGINDIQIIYKQRYLDLILDEKSRNVFIRRSQIISQIRKFLETRGFIEIETPILSQIPSGATAEPFVTEHKALHRNMYLRIATEIALKKAIIGGLERVFEIGRIFRNEGIDRTHNPEFTSIELYQAYANLTDMKVLFRDLLTELKVIPSDFEIKEYEYDALEVDFESKLMTVSFVNGQPLSETPLCKARQNDSSKAERFEAYANGFEIANAYNEINDASEQLKRLNGANDDGLVEAMKYGMPPCGGMGIGIDRLVMLATGVESIRDVIMFPTSLE